MIFLSQLRGELGKLFSRRRTYVGYAVFLVFELILLITFQIDALRNGQEEFMEQNGLSAEKYFSSLTVTFMVMSFSLFLLGSIYFALVAGDIVAKEVEDGNMRMVLARPVSRVRILLLKFLSICLYTITFVLFVGATGYGMALLALGPEGGLMAFSPKMGLFAVYPDWRPAMLRLVVAALLIGVSMCTISAVGFFFSCLKMKPATATIMALSVLFLDMVLQEFPIFKPHEESFITYKMSTWLYAFENDFPWAKLADNFLVLGGLDLSLFALACLVFQLRDFKT
ncbi:ABC transporter permease [Roseibacillus ishigakijimensis]|uniref:ABC transporter permease subunit n=1 Tax=Roseibacillus ishigakijimensis TaxID=454146 RepID=A0A934RTW3_9BACT|nr:ABC transporter permease subunit [Roseibacillus ishigakijimensis]MBK1834954.1 ABC transporter permease subunit [Roseibacillus ishigakijimensis]